MTVERGRMDVFEGEKQAPPKTYVTGAAQGDIECAFAPVREYVEGLEGSRERALASTKLDEAKMWAFAHHRVKAGGSP